MASYSITRECGHDETVKIYGPYKDRDRQAEWEATRLCRECYTARLQADRAAVTAKAADMAQANGLPALEGSPKQIAWAETIRREALDRVSGHYSPPEAQWAKLATKLSADLITEGRKLYTAPIARLVARLEAQTSAKWWIDHGSKRFDAVTEADKAARQDWVDRCKAVTSN